MVEVNPAGGVYELNVAPDTAVHPPGTVVPVGAVAEPLNEYH